MQTGKRKKNHYFYRNKNPNRTDKKITIKALTKTIVDNKCLFYVHFRENNLNALQLNLHWLTLINIRIKDSYYWYI